MPRNEHTIFTRMYGVACLWQACPELTAKEVMELVRRSGDRADFPDNIYGYGVPDMWKAYQDYLLKR